MGILDFFFKKTKADEEVELAVGAIRQGSINGLDFSAAVEAHQAWKARLFKYVNKASDENLDHNAICRDDQCALGKWIHGEAKRFLSEIPEYHKLKASHANFHVAAAEIVEKMNKGLQEKAQESLANGPFSEHSRETQRLLAALYSKMGG